MKRNGLLIFFLLNIFFVSAQDTTKVPTPYYPYPKYFPPQGQPHGTDSSDFVNPKLFSPSLGIGPSLLTFYGDVSDKYSLAPSLGRTGCHLSVSEHLSRSVELSARALFGTVSGSEKGPRFVNFESSIRSGGLNLIYNFDNFLPKKRRIDPFILSGVAYFEFLSKTDLFDKSGNQYHYWSDGSIMNMDQNDANVANAIPLVRDYTFETDIRKSNIELFGKYPERALAVPVGAGVNFHLTTRWHFKLGATMHFSFTDHIDGVTPENKGAGKGKPNKDKYLETYFTLTFDLFNPKQEFLSPLSDEELLALANEDTDGDGVIDFNDSCQGTPSGVTVDAKGCPLDADGDRFPDYKDKEVNSPPGAFVDEQGVAMNDSTIASNWREWSDTAWAYVSYTDTIVNPPAVATEGWQKGREATVVYRRELVILIGNYKEGVPPSEMSKLLSVPDVRSSMQSDSSTSYVAGSFSKLKEAEKRRDEMKASGFPNSKVMVLNKDGSLSEPTAALLAGIKEAGVKYTPPPGIDTRGVVFRVQLGAFSKKLSASVFKSAGQMIVLKTEDGLYKYVTGGFYTIQDAIEERSQLVKKGYSTAFIVAYKDGKRVPLSSVSGGIVVPKNESLEEPKTPTSSIDKNLVFFSVQVGAFASEPPADLAEKFSKIQGLEKKKRPSGINQYLAGKFQNYEEAKKFRDDLIQKYGIQGAFLVAFFKEEMIPVQEAVELLK